MNYIPQFLVILIILLDIYFEWRDNGKTSLVKHNVYKTLFYSTLWISLLWWGNFFK